MLELVEDYCKYFLNLEAFEKNNQDTITKLEQIAQDMNDKFEQVKNEYEVYQAQVNLKLDEVAPAIQERLVPMQAQIEQVYKARLCWKKEDAGGKE